MREHDGQRNIDSLTHHDDVKAYEDRGVSHRDAERDVNEDYFFREMNNTAESNQ